MAIERIYGGAELPPRVPFNTAVPTFVSMLMDAPGEKGAFIVQVPKTGTLDKFEFRIGDSIQLPANGLKCSFQNVDDVTTGDPDGTVDQFRVVTGLAVNSWVVPGLITSDGTDTETKRSVARGELLACVVEFQSFNASDVVNISALDLSATSFVGSPPYSDHFTLAWAKQTNGPVVALKYDDGTYEHMFGCYPIKDLYAVSYDTDSIIPIRALALTPPTDILCGGVYIRMLDGGANLFLVDADAVTFLETKSLNPVLRATTSAHDRLFRFAKDHRLLTNEVYHVSVKPTTITNVVLYEFDVNDAAIMNAMPGGQGWFLSTQVTDGVWSDTFTRRPWMGVFLTGADHDVSGGGGGPGFEGVP